MNYAPPYTRDAACGGREPALKFYINEDNLADLPPGSSAYGQTLDALLPKLQRDGFDGVQLTTTTVAGAFPLEYCTLDRINTAADAESVVGRHADQGHTCLTVHAGWGIEDDDEVDRLLEAMLTASDKFKLPVYLETHRATITQDMWRTVRMVERFPEVRFNGDFSHYYTGQEMVYGGLQMKLDFMQPIMDRVAFIHARIGNPGQIQVAIGSADGRPCTADGGIDFLADFKTIWTRAMQGFRRAAKEGDYLVFCPELLPRQHYYARCFEDKTGQRVEESDRYAEALIYLQVARQCWEASGQL